VLEGSHGAPEQNHRVRLKHREDILFTIFDVDKEATTLNETKDNLEEGRRNKKGRDWRKINIFFFLFP